MLNLVYGGSGSGKSEFAEQLAIQFAQQCHGTLYYIATMKPWDTECLKRIEKHRIMRKKKQFETIECYEHIDRISLPGSCHHKNSERNENNHSAVFFPSSPSVALLECLSNLTANEMFTEPRPDMTMLRKRLFSDIISFYEKTTHLIIVTNNIFEDGMEYDPETTTYQKLLAQLNRMLAKKADHIYEVTAGIASEI